MSLRKSPVMTPARFAEMLDLLPYAEMNTEPEFRSPRERGSREKKFFYTIKARM